ncbi:transcriptional regulator [Rhodococcus sp. 14C212]|uniref:helix-turn-helix transcriptional regulator n=1 Tax=Rhodococcus sp. 14C212 TaxID=2711209 RepID=UPI0013EB4769|nr:transcriptional regulator [Rhodococcus sp. 14C212]NGP04887.1 transcriptional regulator [Rhodococcus sp. 14C212]
MPLSAQRVTVLDDVRAHAPTRVGDVAARLALHTNTVREHLEALVDLGLLLHDNVGTQPARGRGRPARWYRPAPAADPSVSARDYAGLATALAGHLARTSTTPESDARAAGTEWGRELVREYRTGSPSDDPDRTVLALLTHLGFDPVDDGPHRGVALRRCPLLAAARRFPAVVCQVHLGIVEGALDELGAPTAPGLDLLPFAEPGACRLFLPASAESPRSSGRQP